MSRPLHRIYFFTHPPATEIPITYTKIRAFILLFASIPYLLLQSFGTSPTRTQPIIGRLQPSTPLQLSSSASLYAAIPCIAHSIAELRAIHGKVHTSIYGLPPIKYRLQPEVPVRETTLQGYRNSYFLLKQGRKPEEFGTIRAFYQNEASDWTITTF